METLNENVIEWEKNDDRATLTITQGKMKNKLFKYAKKYPDQCQIVAVNDDTSICVHIPRNWINIKPPRVVTDEQKEKARERMVNYHNQKQKEV